MSIPIGLLIDVQSTVLNSSQGVLQFNGLFLTENSLLPSNTMQQFTSAAGVGAVFGTSSTEYSMAVSYFAGYDKSSKKPAKLFFYRKESGAAAAWLRGGSLSGMTVTQLQALSGTLTLTIDGTVRTTTSINLSSTVSFSAAAVTIAAALVTAGATGATCTYSALHGAFLIGSGTTGALSSITFATGTLSSGLKLQTGQGGVLSQGAILTSYTDTIAAAYNINQNWVSFTTLAVQSTAEVLECADWVETGGLNVTFIPHTILSAATDSGATTDILSECKALSYNGVFPMFGGAIQAAALCGFVSCLDATVVNGWRTVAYMTQAGLPFTVSTEAEARVLIDKGYAFIGDWTTRTMQAVFNFIGKNPSSYKWLDAYVGKIWVESTETDSLTSFLLNNAVPNDSTGRSQLMSVIISSVINPAKLSGIIGNGEGLSQVDREQIDSIMGVDAHKNVENNGYYVVFFPLTPEDRASRTVRGAVAYLAQGFVHFVKINNYISV